VPAPKTNSGRRSPRARPAHEDAQLLRFAGAAARAVGRWLARERQRRGAVPKRDKGVGDPVTDLDVTAERKLRERIERRWPTHGFVGEETGSARLDAAHVWVVDPIDGTANFAAGLAPWGVSVACLRDGAPIAGAVYNHPEGVTVLAQRGGGASIAGEPAAHLRLRDDACLDPDAVIGVQWFRGRTRLPFLPRLLATGTRVRVFGCTVVQLCDVARGRLQANVQEQGRIWDVAAAGLVVEEAGGRFTRWDGRPLFPCTAADLERHHATVAAPPAIHAHLVRALRAVPVSRS